MAVGARGGEIYSEVGGTFSLFAGHIVGRRLELVPNERIVQAWRVLPWPEGIYSIARLELVGHSWVGQSSAAHSPQLALSLTTLASHQNLRSTWRAVGA